MKTGIIVPENLRDAVKGIDLDRKCRDDKETQKRLQRLEEATDKWFDGKDFQFKKDVRTYSTGMRRTLEDGRSLEIKYDLINSYLAGGKAPENDDATDQKALEIELGSIAENIRRGLPNPNLHSELDDRFVVYRLTKTKYFERELSQFEQNEKEHHVLFDAPCFWSTCLHSKLETIAPYRQRRTEGGPLYVVCMLPHSIQPAWGYIAYHYRYQPKWGDHIERNDKRDQEEMLILPHATGEIIEHGWAGKEEYAIFDLDPTPRDMSSDPTRYVALENPDTQSPEAMSRVEDEIREETEGLDEPDARHVDEMIRFGRLSQLYLERKGSLGEKPPVTTPNQPVPSRFHLEIDPEDERIRKSRGAEYEVQWIERGNGMTME